MLNCLDVAPCILCRMNDLVQVSWDRLRRLQMLAVAAAKYGDHDDVKAAAITARENARDDAQEFPRAFSRALLIRNSTLWSEIFGNAMSDINVMTAEDTEEIPMHDDNSDSDATTED